MSKPIQLSFDESTHYQAEIDSARKEVASGNLPRSRVYARRALGVLLQAWMLQQQASIPSRSSYDLTNLALTMPQITNKTRELLEHFVQRVDESYQFPAEIDLIEDLERIILLLNINLSQET